MKTAEPVSKTVPRKSGKKNKSNNLQTFIKKLDDQKENKPEPKSMNKYPLSDKVLS